MKRIILASTSPTFEQRIRKAFNGSLNGDLVRTKAEQLGTTPADDLVAAFDESTEVLAIGPDVPTESGLELAAACERARPDVSVILVTSGTPDLWQQAMRCGVRDVIAPDADDEAVRLAFERVMRSTARRRAVPDAPAPAPGPKGRVITVVAPKGGAGKTSITSNLGVALAKAHPGEVVIVDLDLQFGDMSTVLGLEPEQTMYDVARASGTLDTTMAKVFLTPCPGELFVLCAPESPAEGEEIPTERVGEVISLLATQFRYVLIDTPAGLTEHTLTAIDHTTDLLLVCDLARTSVRSMRKVVEALDALGITGPQRHLVLNRAQSRVGLDEEEVISALGMKIDVGVPSSREVPVSSNDGAPLVESNPKSPVSKKLRELAGVFSEVAAKPEPTGGLLARLTS